MRLLFLLPFCLLLLSLSHVHGGAAAEDPKASDPAVVEPGTSRAWALLTCAVLFERNGERHDLLAGKPLDAKCKEDALHLLDDSWDIKTSEHLEEQLEWLRLKGHRTDWEKPFSELAKCSQKKFEELLKSIPDEGDRAVQHALYDHARRVAKLKNGVLAWDLARYVALCRWGYAAGFLTEAQAWKKIEPIAKQLQKSYASWDELGEAFCIGRDCWKPGTNEETLAAFEKLKTDENSPLKSTPWTLKLGSLEKPEPKPKSPPGPVSDPKKKH